jgi:PAS domain S-box-containing protein
VARLQTLLQSGSDGIHVVDRQGNVVDANSTFATMLGYTPAEVMQLNVADWDAQWSPAELVVKLDDLISNPETFAKSSRFETRHRRKDGVLIDVEIGWTIVTLEGVKHIYCCSRDITARNRVEAALSRSEERLNHALAATMDGVWDWNISTGDVYFSAQWARLLGYTPDEVPQRVEFFFTILHPEDVDHVKRQLEDHLAGRTPVKQDEVRLRLKSGGYRWFSDRGKVVVRDEGGRPLRMVGTISDITPRKQAETALRASEERFRELAENIQEVFWISDTAKFQILYVSPAYETIWGRTCEQLYQDPRAWLEAIHPEDRARILHAAESKQAHGQYDETYRIQRPDGALRWIHDRAFPVHGPSGEVLRIVGTAEDVTGRVQLEDQMRRSQKLQTIGTLAAGVAHDFNNILASILGNTELALADTTPEHPAHECLNEIRVASGRAKSLVQQLLAFSSQQPKARCSLAIGPLIEEAAKLLRATLPAAMKMVTLVDADAPPVLADATHVHQILVNLCTNAWHACGDQSGRIEVKLHSVTLDVAATGQLVSLRPGHFACLSVSDTGKGMDAATLERIFDPFFTTKGPGKGVGLGLSVVHGIVKGYEGAIQVVSQVGQGTTFTLYFPASAVASSVSAPSLSASFPRRGAGQHILYLDDEVSLVSSTTRMMERLGYRVTGFTRPADATKAFRDNPGQFDLVITDMNMPDSTGLKVAIELLNVRSDVPIVLSSGSIDEDLRRAAREAGIRGILCKPFTIGEFGEAIRGLS